MIGKSPAISVVIVSYNTRQMTLDCLEKLTTGLGDSSAEIFVVDNGSGDKSAETVSILFPQVILIANQQNVGFGAANNQAIRRATGQFILLLNSDAFPEPGAVASLREYLNKHSNIAAVGPRLLNSDQSLQRSCYRFPSPWRATCENFLLTALLPNHPWFGDFRAWEHDQSREVDFISGACMLVRRSAIDQVGMFDEAFFLYCEETDWCRRFHAAGWRIAFTPDAQVVHLNGGSGKAQSQRVFTEFHRGQERFVQKYHGSLGLAWYRLMILLGSIIRIIMFGLGGLVSIHHRDKLFNQCRRWLRILRWSLGFRGPGLSELQNSGSESLRVLCA